VRVRDWSLRRKQLVSFGLVLLIMSAVQIYSIRSMQAIRVEVDEVSQNRLPRALAISDVNLGTSRLRINQLQLTLATDADGRAALTATSVDLIDQINAALDDYRERRVRSPAEDQFSDEERRFYEAFDAAWEEYQDLSFAFYGLLADGEVEEAVDLLTGDGQQVFERLNESLVRLVSANRAESLEAASRATETFRSTRGISMLWLLATIGLSVVIAGALSHLISGPLTELERASREVAQGDLDVQLAVGGQDEVGSLAQSFNRMTQALREARAERERQAEQLRVQNRELAAAMRDLEETQQQLLLREKMASLGDLVAGVTHELNTPIGAAHSGMDVSRRCLVRLEAALTQAAPHLDEGGLRDAERALRVLRENLANGGVALERISSIVDSLRNFARLDEAEHQRADLHEGLESTLTLMHAELLGAIEVQRDYGDLPAVYCNPGQLNQVFHIVLKNAATAIGEAGTIRIASECDGEGCASAFTTRAAASPPNGSSGSSTSASRGAASGCACPRDCLRPTASWSATAAPSASTARPGRARRWNSNCRSPDAPEAQRAARLPGPLQFQQTLLAPETSAVAGETAVGTDDAVAGYDDGQRVEAVRRAHGPHRRGPADLPGQVRVGPGLAVGDALQRLPDEQLELGAGHRQGQRESAQLPGEVGADLFLRAGDHLGAAGYEGGAQSLPQSAHLRRQGAPVDELQQAECLVGGADEHRSQRCRQAIDTHDGGAIDGRGRRAEVALKGLVEA
jgi:signal transduction histidine kinase